MRLKQLFVHIKSRQPGVLKLSSCTESEKSRTTRPVLLYAALAYILGKLFSRLQPVPLLITSLGNKFTGYAKSSIRINKCQAILRK